MIDVECRLANKYFLKVADLAAIEGDYYKAIAQYEKVAKVSVDNQLMKWSVKDYFFKAGICHLASGVSSSLSELFFLLKISQRILIVIVGPRRCQPRT